MGAYGAALHAMSLGLSKTNLISPSELAEYTHSSGRNMQGLRNKCHLTINTFRGKEKYISGNKCDEATEETSGTSKKSAGYQNVHQFKRDKLQSLEAGDGKRATIGFPLALGMYELAPFWQQFSSRWTLRCCCPASQAGRYTLRVNTAYRPIRPAIQQNLCTGISSICWSRE
jgi:hypothetical protein